MRTDLPNLLTMARILAIPVVVALAMAGTGMGDLAAALLFALAAITDYLDGALARAWGQTSEFGRMMDPIADKLLVAATLMVLAANGRLGPAGLYPALVVLLREVLVSGLREYLAAGRIGLPVTRLAKWKTGAQLGALGLLLLGETGAAAIGLARAPVALCGQMLLWTACVLPVVTGWDYLRETLRHTQAGARQRATLPPI